MNLSLVGSSEQPEAGAKVPKLNGLNKKSWIKAHLAAFDEIMDGKNVGTALSNEAGLVMSILVNGGVKDLSALERALELKFDELVEEAFKKDETDEEEVRGAVSGTYEAANDVLDGRGLGKTVVSDEWDIAPEIIKEMALKDPVRYGYQVGKLNDVERKFIVSSVEVAFGDEDWVEGFMAGVRGGLKLKELVEEGGEYIEETDCFAWSEGEDMVIEGKDDFAMGVRQLIVDGYLDVNSGGCRSVCSERLVVKGLGVENSANFRLPETVFVKERIIMEGVDVSEVFAGVERLMCSSVVISGCKGVFSPQFFRMLREAGVKELLIHECEAKMAGDLYEIQQEVRLMQQAGAKIDVK